MHLTPLRILTALLLSIISLSASAAHSIADVPNVHVSNRTQYVSNPDAVLSATAVDSLNTILGRIWQSTTAEPVVVALDDITDEYDVNTFASKLFDTWGIGKSDTNNGLLILLVLNQRQIVIRTGYGLDGVLPDVTCGRIIRNDAIPHFRSGDYDRGVIAAVTRIESILTDPVAAEEFRSAMENDANAENVLPDLFTLWLIISASACVVMLIIVIGRYIINRRKSSLERYHDIENLKTYYLIFTLLCIGIPLPAFLICLWMMHHLRNHHRKCPNCGHAMHKLDEVTDNQYLTMAQDAEEHINSVDYDVWLCDNCGETDVIPYVNRQSTAGTCPYCGGRTGMLTGNRIISNATSRREGKGERTYKCCNCYASFAIPYVIARLASDAVFIGGPGGGWQKIRVFAVCRFHGTVPPPDKECVEAVIFSFWRHAWGWRGTILFLRASLGRRSLLRSTWH